MNPSEPSRIYLQIPDDCTDYADAAKGEVTWCVDRINGRDIEYVRLPDAARVIAEKMREIADEVDSEGNLRITMNGGDVYRTAASTIEREFTEPTEASKP